MEQNEPLGYRHIWVVSDIRISGRNTSPAVSVIIATFNERPSVVRTALCSILRQTYADFELLVMDDSTDTSTVEAIDALAGDDRVTVVRREKRMGKSRARNIGLEMARGRYIAIMDGDDESLPERLSVQVAFLDAHKDVYMVGGQMNIVNDAGDVVSSRHYPLSDIALRFYSVFRNPIAQPAMMLRRELVDAGLRYNETLDLCEDLDLILRVMNDAYRIGNVSETVLNYREGADFAEKRTKKDEIENMVSVRRSNFDRRCFLRSSMSWIVTWLYTYMPKGLLRKLYKIEGGGGNPS